MVAEPEDRLPTDEHVRRLGEELAEIAGRDGIAIATAESLTAGNLAGHLGRAPASGDWYCGGVIAYRKEVKHDLLGVPDGPVVSEAAARAMASAVAEMMGADVALAVTGEAGPETQEDVPPGTVWFGIHDRGEVRSEHRRFTGDPPDILAKTVQTGLELILAVVGRRR